MESDLKRMVSNAKSFNERNSEIFSDAEKVRKMVSNHMTKINPAYKDPTYTPIATPLPVIESNDDTKQEENGEADADGETDPEDSAAKPRRLVTLHGPSAEKEENRRRETSTPAVLDAADAGESFEGNTFQQAQEKLVTELIQLKNEEYLLTLFINVISNSFCIVVNQSLGCS
jgi:chromatin structure-remodeling complex subunit RSC4